MLPIVLYPEADAAITDILTYTVQNYGIMQAEKYVAAIKKMISHLSEFPQMGKPHPMISLEMRTFPIEQHMIIYRVKNEELHIVTILHQSMDIAARVQAIARLLHLI